MFDLGKFAFGLISDLIWDVIKDGLKTSSVDFFQERKIKSRVEDATAEVVRDLLPFLEQEKVAVEKQKRLIETCVRELKPFSENPAELFKGSLDGQKIFDSLYLEKELPQEIIEDGLKDIYSLLFPRIATLLCKIPAVVRNWENEAWSENFRRFDDVTLQLKDLFAQVDEITNSSKVNTDKPLSLLKRTLTQKIGLELDITGLRASQPLSGNFDDFFVVPEIKKIENHENEDNEAQSITKASDCLSNFALPGCSTIVIGAPGAGKSTWSKWLQRETLKVDWNGLGIRIEFRSLVVDELPSVYDLVRKVAGKQLSEDLTPEKIGKWLNDCKILFILDGFDEIKPGDRNIFFEWLLEIAEFAKGCPFVVTSRPLTTNHLQSFGDSWGRWEIKPFNEPRIIEYISKWYMNTPLLSDEAERNIDANNLAIEWRNDPTINPLTNNPLLLSTLLMVHHLDGKLPNGRANLYKRYVDGMLGVWDERQKLIKTDVQISLDEKRKIIRSIALYMFLSENETIDENLLIERLMSYLPQINVKISPADVLMVLRERTGLIVGPGVYSFAHKTIAEYLVAETVLQGDQKDDSGRRIDRFCLLEHHNEDRWNVVLFLWAGLAPTIDVVSFVEQALRGGFNGLGYGILFDQYERIPLDTKRTLLLKMKNLEGFETAGRAWGLPGWPVGFREKYCVPSGGLRSITIGRSSVEDLLRLAITDNVFSWSDLKSKNRDFDLDFLFFLLFCTISSNDQNLILKKYSKWIKVDVNDKTLAQREDDNSRVFKFEKEKWEDISYFEWGLFVAGRKFSFWRYFDKLDLRKEYMDFIDVFPDLVGFVSLSILSSIVDFSLSSYADNNKNKLDKYIEQALRVFSEEKVENYQQNMLLATKEWRFWHRESDRAKLNTNRQKKKRLTEDFFIEILKGLKKGTKQGAFGNSDHINQITLYCKALKKHRAKLEGSM